MKSRHPDYFLFLITTILLVFGFSILASVSAVFSQEKFGSSTYLLFHQIAFGLIPGILLGLMAYTLSLDSLKKIALPVLLLNLILMGLVFVPSTGLSFGGAKRWVNFVYFAFQPSEFLKLSFILYLAAWLSKEESDNRRSKLLPQGRTFFNRQYQRLFSKNSDNKFLPFLAILSLISAFLILQPDISTLVIIFLTAVVLYFVSGAGILNIFLMCSAAGAGLFVLINTEIYRFNRFLVFLHPETDPMGIGYQTKQALIAVGSGGISGLGLGMSVQKFGFLPKPMTDSIFAVFAEEAGFIGAFILLLIFFLFVWRGMEIAKNAENKFSRLAGFGISFWIIFQVFVNISSMIGIFPITGIPLPFLSYGGSALAAELIGVGILLNISKKK